MDMDNLYSNLENYNEVYIVEELRNENKELKLKLEEYETAIGKLQKSLLQDYDKLVIEFNNLQTNYSSLLKTARAEVERKAQTITQLNLDKDMMVLKTLQNGNNRFRNRLQNNFQNYTKTNNVESNVNIGKKAKNGKQCSNIDDNSERCKTSSISSKASATTAENTKLLNIVDKVVEKVEACISKRELKENVPHYKPPHKDIPEACSIKKRRKSMPAVNISQFNTDEYCETVNPTNTKFTNEMPPQEIPAVSNIQARLTNVSNERLSSKTSETTSNSGRSSNYKEPVKEDYRSGTNRHMEPEKFKGSHRFSDKSGDSEKLQEKDKYREGDEFSHKDRKDDHIREGEGDEHKEGYKSSDTVKREESHKCRESLKSRDSGKFRDDVNFKEREKSKESGNFRDNEEYKEGDKSRQINKYRIGDRTRESDMYREGERWRESDTYRESDKHRESERYRIGDKNRNNYRLKEDKYRDADKYRSRDKFDPSYRYRRRYSPDRPYKRNLREFQSDRRYGVLASPPPEPHRELQGDRRPDYRRYRVLASPSPEPHRELQGDQRPDFGRHRASPPSEPRDLHHQKISRYDVSRHKSDIHKYSHDSESVLLPDNNDEPVSKRQKIEYEVPNDGKKHHDREPSRASCLNEHDMLRVSCQSPDVIFSPDSHTDSTLAHTIKEIKSIAAIQMEDPRVTSKKYVIQVENGTDTLSTVASKGIHIKPVDKSLWNIKSVAIPDALLHEPQSKFSVEEVYMDLDNLEPNVSVESGEIYEDNLLQSVPETVSCLPETKNNFQVHDVNKTATDMISTQKNKPENAKQTSTANKIAQVIQNIPITFSNVTKDLGKVVCEDHLTDKNILIDNQTLSNLQPRLLQIDQHENLLSSNKDKHTRISLSEMAMVQDDLELSDETSDNVEYHMQIAPEKESFYRTESTVEARNTDLVSKTAPVIKLDIATNEITTDVKIKESESHKKQKSKKRKTKSKEKEVSITDSEVNVIEKKKRSKKEKDKKNKFTDLFGDSSSLITPEDLGIPTTCVPLCEDAQDAVDININEIVKVPTSYADTENVRKDNLQNLKDVKSKIIENIDSHVASTNVDTNIIYKNLNAETDIPNVVKTVIISSGIQPQFMLDSGEGIVENRIDHTAVNKQHMVDYSQLPSDLVECKKQIALKALATSTPHKEFPSLNTRETDSGTSDCASVCSDSKTDRMDTKETVIDQSNPNIPKCHDAPDVRIFVRRRKKSSKKN